MILNLKQTSNLIEQDIVDNQRDVFNLLKYYRKKYSRLSNRINDVNVGFFINEDNEPTVQIYLKNKTGLIRKRLIFNYHGTKIINQITLNDTTKQRYTQGFSILEKDLS